MSDIDAWIYVEVSALDALWDLAHPVDPETPIPASAQLLVKGAVRGFWNNLIDGPTTYEVVNVLKTRAEIDAFVAANTADIFAVDAWIHGKGYDDFGYGTDVSRILSVMKDHIVAGATPADPPSFVPATLANPNWGHIFLGQRFIHPYTGNKAVRRFAGAFSTAFNEGFL